MMVATVSSTSGASSRFIDRRAVKRVSKSASVVFRNTGMAAPFRSDRRQIARVRVGLKRWTRYGAIFRAENV
jgi:hypothetical protein